MKSNTNQINSYEAILEPQREVEQAPSNEVKSFFFGSDEVRTLSINNAAWFVGSDVAKVLGYTNPPKALKDHVDPEDKKAGITIRYSSSDQRR